MGTFWLTPLALALLGGAGVGLELTLTRIVSTLYSATYVYLVLAVALLGLALGAALLSLFPSWSGRAAHACMLACFASAALVVLVLQHPGLPAVFLVVAAVVPFGCAGLAVAAMFARQPARSGVLYWADLSGAGLGALLALPALNAWGVPIAALVAALLFGLAGVLLAPTRGSLLTFGAVCSVVVWGSLTGLTALNLTASDKPIAAALAGGGTVTKTRWDALTRTDLVFNAEGGTYALYMDGGAGSVVPDLNRPWLWRDDIGSFPFLSDPPERTFLLGPGGGLDVALAKASGAAGLEAAELSGAALELVQGLAPQVGDIYSGVNVIQDEGRRALERSGQFDLIFLSHVITGSAELRTQALGENQLYTTEAFEAYLDHLTPQGQLAVKLYDEVTLTRALTTALQVFVNRGVPEAEAITHFVALLETSGERPVPLLLIRRKAVSQAEAVRLGRLAEARGYALLLLPHLLYPPPLAKVASGEGTLGEVVAASTGVNLRPTTDDRPFFFLFGPLPRSLFVLVLVLLGLAGMLLALSLRIFRDAPPELTRWRGGTLFLLLGGGFMLVEIVVLQRAQLIIGQPTQTLSWVLAVLLVSGGLGSYLIHHRLTRAPQLHSARFCVLIAFLLLLWGGLEPHFALTLPLLLSLVPVGFALGIPFALALRPLTARQVAFAWALSGVGSTLASSAALVLAARYGYHAVWLSALCVYGLATVVTFPVGRGRFLQATRGYFGAES